MKEVHKKSDVPTGHHYAVITYQKSSIHHAAEGHGYPAYDEDVLITVHYVTTDKADWEKKINALELGKKKDRYIYEPIEYVAFEVARLAQVKLKVEVGIE